MEYIEAEKVNENSTQFTTLCGILATLGFYWQFKCGFTTLPFPMNIILLPFTLIEWTLMFLVGVQ